MSWRPEGWEDTRKLYEDGKYSGEPNTIYDFDIGSFEAGADAILEALRGKGNQHCNDGNLPQYILYLIEPGEKGHLVFIPDEGTDGI